MKTRKKRVKRSEISEILKALNNVWSMPMEAEDLIDEPYESKAWALAIPLGKDLTPTAYFVMDKTTFYVR